MGLGDFIKRGVGEMMIARPDAAKQYVVWKHPDPTIPMFSQLTVYPDEAAIFFRDGKVVGVLRAGRHTLDSSNIPFLSNLIDSFTGGNVLKAEVYFVTTREIPDVKFGGKIGELEDPETGLVAESMVHGTFSYMVKDPVNFVVGIVGVQKADNASFESWFKQMVLKVIRDRIAEMIVKKNWGLLKVTSGAYTEEIETDVINGIGVHVNQYGIQIMKLGNFVIGIDDDAKETIRDFKKKMAFQKGMGAQVYSQFQMADAVRDAGKGMAKGGGEGGNNMLGGASLGIGFGMANMFQQQYQQPPQQYQQPPQYQQQQMPPAAPQHQQQAAKKCPGCGTDVPQTSKFCLNCGQKIEETKPKCPACNSEVLPNAKFCGNCGGKIG